MSKALQQCGYENCTENRIDGLACCLNHSSKEELLALAQMYSRWNDASCKRCAELEKKIPQPSKSSLKQTKLWISKEFKLVDLPSGICDLVEVKLTAEQELFIKEEGERILSK